MFKKIFNDKYKLAVWLLIGAYIAYFSYHTILRYQTLYASYFDLGIMHQTVYNTFRGLASGDWSRILELTNPFGPEQIKRMVIHNDILLALLSPFYFLYSGPETLLVIQTAVIGLGAWGIFRISQVIFKKNKYADFLSLVFAFAYLIYPTVQRTNLFDFHPVALSTGFLIFMFYFWLVKRFKLSFLFLVLSLLSKEQVGLTTGFFGIYILYTGLKNNNFKLNKFKNLYFPLAVIITSFSWFFISVAFLIPYFRGGTHFALKYYGEFGDSPVKVMFGIFSNPQSLTKYIFHIDTFRYFWFLLGPLGFLPLFALPVFLVVSPEFSINLLSNNWNMRNIIYHYTAVIQPFIFISAIYGARWFTSRVAKMSLFIGIFLLITSLLFAYFKGPLPFAREQEVHPFKYPQKQKDQVAFWADKLKDERLKIAGTGKMAPHFTSRRYFYNFSENYILADYVVLRRVEIYNYPEKNSLIPVYEKLVKDPKFERIYSENGLEVYKKIK